MAIQSLEIIKAEHRSLAAVINAANYLISASIDRQVKPDPELLKAMLYYIQEFPEKLHHPKEEALLFSRLKRRTHAADTLIEELEAQHRGGNERMLDLNRAFEKVLNDEQGAMQEFANAMDAFAQLTWRHMQVEETELMPLVERYLSDDDKTYIARAFLDNKDPLFEPDAKNEFRDLFRKIVNMAPAPIGLGSSS